MPGDAFLVVKITPALELSTRSSEDKARTYTGNLSFEYGEHHHLQIVRKLPDTADTVVWVIGLDSVRPFRVDRAEDPGTCDRADRLTGQVRSSTRSPNTASAASRS